MNERIKKIRKDAGLTLDKFGTKIGISAPSCSQLESGKTNPSAQTLAAICRVFRVNEQWLRTGEGEPYRKLSREEELTQIFESLMIDDSAKSKIIRALADLPEEWFDTGLAMLTEFYRKLNAQE